MEAKVERRRCGTELLRMELIEGWLLMKEEREVEFIHFARIPLLFTLFHYLGMHLLLCELCFSSVLPVFVLELYLPLAGCGQCKRLKMQHKWVERLKQR